MMEDKKSEKKKIKVEKEISKEQEDIQHKNESLHKAGSIIKEVKNFIKPKIKVGAKALEIISIAESKIMELGGNMAFPINLCINNVAAHYTSPLRDDGLTLEENDLIKIDIGVHIDGYIVDSAFTVNFKQNDKSLENIIQSTEVAVDAAKMMAKPQVNTREIGKKIESIVKGFNYRPIKELGGHQIERWVVHGKKSLPELGNQKGSIMEEGDIFAIEVFSSTGEGSVHMTNNSFIYELNPYSGRVPLRRKASKQILGYINKNYKTLPFAERWLANEFNMGIVFGLQELVSTNKLKVHYVLAENKGIYIAQSEETLLITKDGFEQLT